jgi:type II secretory pathway predicted ATPase ExeA
MYERHFGFSEKPFNLTPDSRYLFLASRHQEAYANLEFGVREGTGFLLVTGEVGTGKTTLIRHFLSQVGPDVRTAVILYPALSAGELFHAILQDLGVPFAGGSLKDAVDALAKALIEAKALGLKVVVLIDEAQSLKPHVLEQLRLLSNLETEREKLLTVVLVGQPELRDMLDQPQLRQLSQRITSRSHLDPLNLEQTRNYIRHRLVIAGGTGDEISDQAARRVHVLSGGVPRLVNLLCDRALLGAFGRAQKTVDVPLVDAAAAEILPRNRRAGTSGSGPWLEALGLFLLGLLVVFAFRYLAAKKDAEAPSPSLIAAVATPTPTAAPSSAPSIPPSVAPSLSPTKAPTPPPVSSTSMSPAASPALVQDVRCGSAPRSRAAAIAAVEEFLGTPGFDSAQATLSFEQWRALRLPAIAPFRTGRGPCEAAILPQDASTTAVADDSGRYEMPNPRLGAQYLGSAILCFVDKDGVLAKPTAARLAWARKLLERKGLIAPGSPETALNSALSRVGAGVGVKNASSVEGPLLAALYSLDSAGRRRAVNP